MGAVPESCWMQEARHKDPCNCVSPSRSSEDVEKATHEPSNIFFEKCRGAPNFEQAAFRRSTAVFLQDSANSNNR